MEKQQVTHILISILFFFEVAHGNEKCFCELKGQVEDCCCSIETVDQLNNEKIFPRVTSLVKSSNYFKYFKVNLNKGCPFWPDDSRCAIKDCAVDVCSEEEIPIGIKTSKYLYSSVVEEEDLDNEAHGQCAKGDLENLGNINSTISDEQLGNFVQWSEFDEIEDKFCDIDDELSPDMKYVDLTLNPEKYTGYSGFSANRIWNSIYKENCFFSQEKKPSYANLMKSFIENMCLERRIFYRAISGMHASINIHLAYNYLLSGPLYGKKVWGPNIQEFRKRFDPKTTKGQGPLWLKNLYITYLLVLRAVTKAKPYWEHELFYTGNEKEDKMAKDLVLDIVKIALTCPSTFDESLMFSGDPGKAKDLKEEFRSHFYNITRIMDCVGCDKCRLWGKLQTQGLGTAFKILFSSDNWETIPIIKGKQFKLTRTEIVALFNALGRYKCLLGHAVQRNFFCSLEDSSFKAKAAAMTNTKQNKDLYALQMPETVDFGAILKFAYQYPPATFPTCNGALGIILKDQRGRSLIFQYQKRNLVNELLETKKLLQKTRNGDLMTHAKEIVKISKRGEIPMPFLPSTMKPVTRFCNNHQS